MSRDDNSPNGLTGPAVIATRPSRDQEAVGESDDPRSPSLVLPIGLSPGGVTFLGAWLVGLAIARLTGAAAVILLLAAGIVGFGLAALGGWLAVRRLTVVAIAGASACTVGESTDLTVELARRPRQSDQTRISIAATKGFDSPSATTTLPGGGETGLMSYISHERELRTTTRFERAGVIDRLYVRVESAGPAGLIWWRRATSIATDHIHVAPVADGPLLDIDERPTHREGPSSNRRGNHGGEIDGVRPWREGDGGEAVHWPSTLRSRALIVHDRDAATETTWVVPFDVSGSPARLRRTLDEGLREQHVVSLEGAQASGEPVSIRSATDSIVWSAELAQHVTNAQDAEGTRVSFLKQPLRWPRHVETDTTIGGRARLSTAVAAFLSLAMLLGALSTSAGTTLIAAIGVATGAAVSYYFARSGKGRPLLLRIGVAVAAMGALALIAVDANGVGGLLAALRGPMPDLLMLLVVLHGFEVTDRRTMRVHQAITFVVAAYAAGLRIDGALGWWLAAWAVAFVIAVLSTTRLVAPVEPSATYASGHSRQGVRQSLTTRQKGRGLSSVAAWTIAAACATLALLAVVPIPDGPARLGFPALSNDAPTVDGGVLAAPDGSLAQSGTGDGTRGSLNQAGGYLGFSETLDTSIRGDLGDEIVMRVRAPEPAFWRGQTFTEFDGRTWTVSANPGIPRTGPSIVVPPTVGDALASGIESKTLVQTYFIEADLPNVVFAAYRPEQLVLDGTVWTRPDGALRSDVTLTKGSVYTVVSDRLQVTPEILRGQGDVSVLFDDFRQVDTDNVLDPFLAVPDSTTARTIELAEQLRTPGESTYDTIIAYQTWLAANTVYDLNAPVPAAGADAVDDYLFESRRGFCEQIASTLAIMLRSQGVPTRLATGYIPGERDRVSGVWKVRASDAHSWVEVWFPQTGWEAFDPTSSVPLAGDAAGATVGGDLFGAAVTSVSSHPIKLGLAGLLALVSWGTIKGWQSMQHRRRRGRWGLLQDRFSALDPTSNTNPAVAEYLSTHFDESADPRAVAEVLDRAAFDPSWIDDEESFARATSAVDVLERRSG